MTRGLEMEKKLLEIVENRMSEFIDQFAVKQATKVEEMMQANMEKMMQARVVQSGGSSSGSRSKH